MQSGTPRLVLTVFVLATAWARAEEAAFDAAWRATRAAQPAGLSLELRLPKSSFHQGEMIPATLTFRNESADAYHLWTGNYDRAGRIPDISFHAESATGKPVEDPLAWYFGRGFSMGGLGGVQDFGQWSITLAANQWLRLDQPGTYRLYARSTRVQKGTKEERHKNPERTELVSDLIEIEIVPLTGAREKQLLAEIEADLDKDPELARAAAERLRCLQTPAAQELRLRVLQTDMAFSAAMGFFASPDPQSGAGFLLEAVARPDVAVTSDMLSAYYVLKLGSLAPSPAAIAEARNELVQQARRALPNKRGRAFHRTIETLFTENPQDPNARAMLVTHQEELAPDRVEWLLHSWDRLGGPELLPMLRKAVQPPHNSALALGRLAQVAPDEARRIILEDVAQEKSRFLRSCCTRFDLMEFTKLPDRELPELDSVFQHKFEQKGSNAFTLMPLVARYATTNLLPVVVAAYQKHEGRWACEFQTHALKYWLRCDPQGGVEALRRALAARESTGCFRMTLPEVLLDNWVAEALPVVLAALDDDNPSVVVAAAKVLEKHGPPEAVARVIAAAERLQEAKPGTDKDEVWNVESLVHLFATSKRWELSDEQIERLTRWTQNPLYRQLLERRRSKPQE